jgi:hypothetical protein
MSNPPPTTTEMAFFLIATSMAILLSTKQRKPLGHEVIAAINVLLTLALISIVLLRSTELAATFAIAALSCARE